MENKAQTVQERFSDKVKRLLSRVFGWDPGGCSLWIFGDEDSADRDMRNLFEIKEERTQR